MRYTIIKTKPYESSIQEFLWGQQDRIIKSRDKFKIAFSQDPFATGLQTHDIYTKNDKIIYTSYIDHKIRLIWLMVKPDTILPYRIIEDHDYHKLKKLYPAILSLTRYVP